MALLLLAMCAGCGRKGNFYSVNPDGTRSSKYSRVNQYTSYEPGRLAAQAEVARAYEAAQHAPPPSLDIEIHNASLPPGVTFDDGVLKIAEDAPYAGVGRFEIGYFLDPPPEESEIEEDLVRLAAVTSSDVVIVEVTRAGHGSTRVAYMNGLLLRRRP